MGSFSGSVATDRIGHDDSAHWPRLLPELEYAQDSTRLLLRFGIGIAGRIGHDGPIVVDDLVYGVRGGTAVKHAAHKKGAFVVGAPPDLTRKLHIAVGFGDSELDLGAPRDS